MSRFHQLLIDVGNLDFIDADSAELTLVRTSSADSFSKVPVQRHQVESLPGSVKILPNDPGSAYELRLLKGKKSVASGFFVMPGYDHALVAQDLRTAWPIQFDQSFDLESRLSDKADTLALEAEVQSRELSDSDLQDQIDSIVQDVSDQGDAISTKASQTDLDTLAGTVADVQNLAEVNQLNITTKADQADLDTLQTTVTGQGITLAQKADQTALDALGTVVSGKATPADITAAIAALVDGAPAALDTLAELATALSGEQAQIADILAALALRVRVDAIQSLTLAQQLQARQNINAEQAGVAAGLVAAITPASIGAATAVQGGKADTALQSGDVAPVALSGQYSDLAGLPTIPSLSSSTPAAPTTSGTAGTATTAARGDHAHPLPTASQITAALLTGLATGAATAIAAADTILQALAKLQAQASENAALLAPVPRKVLSGWYKSGYWYDSAWPYPVTAGATALVGGTVRLVPFTPNTAMMIQAIGINITVAAAAGGTLQLGIYADLGELNIGAPLFRSAPIAADTTGEKIAAASLTLTAGVTYWLAVFPSLNCTAAGTTVAPVGYSNANGTTVSIRYVGVTELPVSIGTVLFTGTQSPRIMLQAG